MALPEHRIQVALGPHQALSSGGARTLKELPTWPPPSRKSLCHVLLALLAEGQRSDDFLRIGNEYQAVLLAFSEEGVLGFSKELYLWLPSGL